MPVPILILQNATEDTLIVTEEHECDQAAYRNAYLDTFAFTKPMSHLDGLIVWYVLGSYTEGGWKNTQVEAFENTEERRKLVILQWRDDRVYLNNV